MCSNGIQELSEIKCRPFGHLALWTGSQDPKVTLGGNPDKDISAKDVALNLLARFGANSLLGYSVEIYGETAEKMTLDQRITISSMATEMGAIIILFPPSSEIIDYCSARSVTQFTPVYADPDAIYAESYEIDAGGFIPMVSRPGAPHDAVSVNDVFGLKIDSGFIGAKAEEPVKYP